VSTSASNRSLIITADDTTGALESAAQIADAGWVTRVAPHCMPHTEADGLVIDLRSRHEAADVAAARLRAVVRVSPVRVHKIDSTLRGNWPAEIAAALQVGRRVLMVPSFPAAGRICRDGIVTEHGVPVDRSDHGRDPRAPVLTSRPATLLPGADELPTLDDVRAWLAGHGRVAVADAGDAAALEAVVSLSCGRDEVLLVGTAAVVGAVARSLGTVRHVAPQARVEGPVLVVCGSLHPVSRAQLAALVDAGARIVGGPTSTDAPSVSIVTSADQRHGEPATEAATLARRAHELVRAGAFRTVVLVGGDTAEAFIGDRVVRVTGSLDVGVALGSIDVDGSTVAVVAKPGAFGRPNTLVDLMGASIGGRT
jgi:uncharacterized protein YgbK (DUF1537 family)